ncbi:hypothetical protein I9054_011270 [Acinetobacter bereziniae]|uniref:Uncharacterized protein n=1 Tax=Acinetobacter bereziniae TaxID=106648 RepID=A0A8I1DI59_ACIBZ|nr:papain-like cysteine protease family protein [Acinetobacter bereziniae]QQC82822.1 hypothetical protein I9190_10855 [Acinetobacter bereziniae]UUN95966.1 hypothetical protein I9054_011270 [Acinetobacter bereziniae]
MNILVKTIFISLIFFKSFASHAYLPAMPPMAPPPIDLPIQNIPQETNVWCWAAVVQQIMLFKNGPFNTPPQCSLVAVANNINPNYCCANLGNCAVTGDALKIQQLLSYFNGSATTYTFPANPMALYQTLAQRKPVIIELSQPYKGMTHVVVVRGMGFAQTPMGIIPVLHINDPMGKPNYTQPVPFNQIAPIWKSAIVVHN